MRDASLQTWGCRKMSSNSTFKETTTFCCGEHQNDLRELYPMIGKRQPEDCPAHGNKVSLTNMGWLQEIQRELQEIGVNRDGLWHLKETSVARYDRDELYEKVWAQPIQQLAEEYGVSNVTLAKACKRRRVPVPGRGYWAKKAAGKPVPIRPPLPPG